MFSLSPQQPLLRPYVKQVHHFTINPMAMSSMTAIPTGNVFLSLFWGSGAYVTQRPNTTERAETRGIFISGQQSEIAHQWVKEGEVTIIGLELTPHAIHQFFGVPQQETFNQVLRLEDVWCNKALQIYQEVVNESDPIRQLAMVEYFLCQRILSKEWRENQTIDEATKMINQSNGNICISKLASQLRISTRSLERRFLQSVGVSPKAYSKVMQFNYAFRQLALCNKHILDVVSDAGYYDQPHLINHFRKVFGMSPGQFFESKEKFLDYFEKDQDDCSVDSLSDILRTTEKLYVF